MLSIPYGLGNWFVAEKLAISPGAVRRFTEAPLCSVYLIFRIFADVR